jgi:hypothetical protein
MEHDFQVGDLLISRKYGCIVEVVEIDPTRLDGPFIAEIFVLDYVNYDRARSDNNRYLLQEKDVIEFVHLNDRTKILYGK